MDDTALDRLLRRARRREPEALGALVDEYSPRVFGLLYRLTGSRDAAEDLLQETFLRVVRTIGHYEHVGKFEAWLFRIAANLARDRARRTGRRGKAVSLELAGDGQHAAQAGDPPGDGDPARRLERAEAGERLVAALEQLSDTDREIVLLRHYSGLSFREIAALLRIPLGTALARAHRALAHLRAALGGEEA